MSFSNCYCLLITTGARCISELLKNCSLEVLVVGGNNIGDDGITAIAGALGKSRIRELYVHQCGITVSGAKELATGLSLNSSITVLFVSDNPITVEGACLLLKSAVDNGVCENVIVNFEYEEDNEVQKMMSILETRRMVGTNITWYNCCHVTRLIWITTLDLLMMEKTRVGVDT